VTPLHPGRLLILVGLIVVLVGLLVNSGALNWFGRLPGDLRIARPDGHIMIPWVSLLVVSIVFNLLVWLGRRFLF
jgi:membrane protein implicated in regulation of membrane protease activity